MSCITPLRCARRRSKPHGFNVLWPKHHILRFLCSPAWPNHGLPGTIGAALQGRAARMQDFAIKRNALDHEDHRRFLAAVYAQVPAHHERLSS
jgi:hypothetical protein